MISLKQLWLATAVATLIASPSWASYEDLRCAGHEGPKPLLNFKSEATLLSTKGGPREFMLWENSSRIVYRNESEEIFSSDLTGANETFLQTSSKPLASIADAKERFLLTADDSWIFDTKGSSWKQYSSPFEYPRHVFWHRDWRKRDWLYSIKSMYNLSGEQRLEVSEYQAGASQAKMICRKIEYKPGNGYHIGEGHSYPFIYLYRVLEEEGLSMLHLYQLDVRSCHLQDKGEYKRPIEGSVQSVHWFEPLKRIAVKIDHPTKNFMWSSGIKDDCRLFDIGNDSKPLVLNHKQPIVATHDPKTGLRLVYLSSEEAYEAYVAKEVPITSLSEKDVMLTSDGRTLFMAPTLPDTSRGLLRITLPTKKPEPN